MRAAGSLQRSSDKARRARSTVSGDRDFPSFTWRTAAAPLHKLPVSC